MDFALSQALHADMCRHSFATLNTAWKAGPRLKGLSNLGGQVTGASPSFDGRRMQAVDVQLVTDFFEKPQFGF